MCRVASITNGNSDLKNKIADLQRNGGDLKPEFWERNNVILIHNRFKVTSEELKHGTFPLEGDRFVINYNGEVFQWKEKVFDSSKYKSDVHFALEILESKGIKNFLKYVDFQGTYQIYDKLNKELYIVVDQLNTAGCFYSVFEDKIIVASEYSTVNSVLNDLKAPKKIPINIIKNGTYLKINENLDIKKISYRMPHQNVWKGNNFSKENFLEKVEEVTNIIYQTTKVRIPVEAWIVA